MAVATATVAAAAAEVAAARVWPVGLSTTSLRLGQRSACHQTSKAKQPFGVLVRDALAPSTLHFRHTKLGGWAHSQEPGTAAQRRSARSARWGGVPGPGTRDLGW